MYGVRSNSVEKNTAKGHHENQTELNRPKSKEPNAKVTKEKWPEREQDIFLLTNKYQH